MNDRLGACQRLIAQPWRGGGSVAGACRVGVANVAVSLPIFYISACIPSVPIPVDLQVKTCEDSGSQSS